MKNNLNELYEKLILEGYNIANRECFGGYPDSENCSWYHKCWMLLRFLGMVSNPFWHETFYREAIKKYNLLNSKILIAGTADFSMPLLCSQIGCKKITVFDLCNTPLIICDRASEILNEKWETKQQDICEYYGEKYNAVINDAFLSRFEDKSKPLSGISNLLCEGGYYITTLKKKSNTTNKDVAVLKEKFVSKAVDRFNSYKGQFPELPIKSLAEIYINKMKSCPVIDDTEIKDLFIKSDLKIISINKKSVPGEYEPSEYYQIIAQK